MKLYVLSLFINLILIILIAVDGTYNGLSYITIPAFTLTLFGIIYQLTKKNIFGYIAITGFVFLLPIGILGILAIRNEMDKIIKSEFIRKFNNE